MSSNEFEITNGTLSVTINLAHGSITRLRDSSGTDWLWRKDLTTPYRPESGGLFPMIPYANRVAKGSFLWDGVLYKLPDNNSGEKHGLHGDAWQGQWDVVHRSSRSSVLRHRGSYGPFEYLALQTIQLADNVLRISVEITHLDEQSVPYGVGFHPWFIREADTELWAPAHAMWEEDADHFPTRRILPPDFLDFSKRQKKVPGFFVNNLFERWEYDVEIRARILYPNRNATLSIAATPNLKHYMLYVGSPEFFCVEPVSHLINEINNEKHSGLTVLAKGETLSAKMSIEVDRQLQ